MAVRATGEAPMYVDRHADGTATLRGERGVVGWLREGVLGFRGYHSALDAIQGAMAAHAAAHAHLKLHGVAARQCDPGRSLTTTCEGGRTWIRVGGAPVALLLPPHAELRSGPNSYAFELLVPTYLGDAAAVRLARDVHSALVRCGCARSVGDVRAAESPAREAGGRPLATASG